MTSAVGASFWTWLALAAGAVVALNVLLVVALAVLARSREDDEGLE
ncbi:MAG: hypothetical protein NZL88_07030 [Gaiellaceae bacterium]|nr:hypothetical protein [Gaiellaceae bacterium]